MNHVKRFLVLSAVCLSMGSYGTATRAQDAMNGAPEPIVASIDPSKLTYDILVDGNLTQDEPANNKYKTVQAAYEAAPEGTPEKSTIVGIKPNVYQLSGGQSGPSLSVTKPYITFLGLTNNRRSVVLADNRGHSQGASDNGYIIDVSAVGFTVKNMTLLNYCNTDYEYPGDPSKNLKMRGPTITQAVAFQPQGDKLVVENVALLSRLDTIFLRSPRSYFKNVYIEGTADFIGGGQYSYWEDCTIYFPVGGGVMSASQIAFVNCKFQATRGLQFYKSEFGGGSRPVALINCVMPVNTPQAPVAWVRGQANTRPSVLSLTYHVKDTTGKPCAIYDSASDTTHFASSREISDQEVLAFNPWNILRATANGTVDDWDPAGAKGKYEAAGQGSLIFRMAVTGNESATRSGAAGTTIGATVFPDRAADKTIKWSTDSKIVSLSATSGPAITVTGNNLKDAEYVLITATAANGFRVNAWVYVEPKYIDSPKLTAAPVLSAPADGKIAVNYVMDLGNRADQSVITWSACDDASGANPRVMAVSRGDVPLKAYTLMPGDVGKFIRVGIQPKHNISDPGPEVVKISSKPIAAADVKGAVISPDFHNFVLTTNTSFSNGLWSVLGTWQSVTGDKFINGYGARAASQGAALVYCRDDATGDMQVEVVMTPEKSGMGFGSVGSSADGDRVQKSDVYIKYDARTNSGYALRFWRTTQSAQKCMYQLFKIENGVASPLNDQQVLTGVLKQNTHVMLRVVGTKFTAEAHNDVDGDTLGLEATITPNKYGGAGIYWAGTVPRGNSNVYSQIKITYPSK